MSSDHGQFGTLPRAQAGDRPDAIALPSCPFCGGLEIAPMRDARWVNGHHYVMCLECGGRAGERELKDDAIAAWEQRV